MQLHHIFIDIAKKLSDKEAINDCSTGTVLSYSRALIASLILAKFFKKFEKGSVGLMLPTSAGCVLSYFALLFTGRVPVMINYSTGAEKNVRFAQRKCAFSTVITSKKLLEKIECPHVEGMIYIEEIMASVGALDKARAALLAALPAQLLKKLLHEGDNNDTAVMLFTSGSEKDPKTVPLTHKNLLTNISDINKVFHFEEGDIFLSSLPFFHVFGLTTSFLLPISHGLTMITYANPLDFKKICGIVREKKATFLVGTPAFFWGYLRRSRPGDFSSLRIALAGADKCPEALRNAFFEKHGITLYEGYGATECSPVIATNCPEANLPGSVGKPMPSLEVRIENYETGTECASGEDGRILVKGDSIMNGYFNDFEQTSLHLRNGWYDTGDMGNIDDDGYLWHVGRLKRFVKIGGEMVSLVKIEDVLEKFLPEAVLCCVVEVPDATKGAKIIAVITEEVNEKQILKDMAEHLSPISLPKKFLYRESLPKMGSGKLDFRAITEIARQEINSPR